jgi:DUF1365 family protein
MGELSSALYVGHVSHSRHAPRRHGFRMPLYMLYLDLGELDQLDRRLPLFSVERPNALSFRRRDYLGAPDTDLRAAVLDRAEQATGERPEGPVRVLTHVRALGYVFNPVSFYYCFDRNEQLRTVVAEVTNTPWGERHAYVLPADDAGGAGAGVDKRLHVSPFMPMAQRYRFRASEPAAALSVHVQNREHGEAIFDASLQLRRRPLSSGSLARVLLRHPAMALSVHTAIHAHALALLLKGVRFHPHPGRAQAAPPLMQDSSTP